MRAPDLVFQTVEVTGRYSNRPDLLEQLRKINAILSGGGQSEGVDAKVTAKSAIRSRRLRDRFSLDDLQVMIDLYRSGTTAKQVAEKFGVSLRSVKRLLHQHGVRRTHRARHPELSTITACRDTAKLLLAFAAHTTAKQPADLDLTDLDTPMIATSQHLKDVGTIV